MFYIFHLESDKIIKYFDSYNEANTFFTDIGYLESDYGINATF
jgi:hypothetical protein